MTHNIETALGVTGVEGIFRLSCEQVRCSPESVALRVLCETHFYQFLTVSVRLR